MMKLTGIQSHSTSPISKVYCQKINGKSYVFSKKIISVKNSSLNISVLDNTTNMLRPIAEKNIGPTQDKKCIEFKFTEHGLHTLREIYGDIPGPPEFMLDLLNLQKRSERHLDSIQKHPECYPYFNDGDLKEYPFLVIPNSIYYPGINVPEDSNGIKKQCLLDHGIALCAWFVHKDLDSLKNEKTRHLLDQLACGENRKTKDINIKYASDETEKGSRNSKSVNELRHSSEYFASILDLTKDHVPLLTDLKEKLLHHLKETYWVDASKDSVQLYFHFPYQPGTVTLHLHVRVNHGLSSFEESRAFTIDELISGFSQGKSIDEMILEKQNKNGGKFFKYSTDDVKWMLNQPGISVKGSADNPLRLDPKKSKKVERCPHEL